MFRRAATAVFGVSPEGVIAWCDARAKEIWGTGVAEEMTGQPFAARLATSGEVDLAALAGDGAFSAQGRRADGTVFDVELEVAWANEVGSFVVMARVDADGSGAARGTAGAPDRRRAAGRESDALAFVSHEIRNPLSALLGWADLLAESALDEEQSRMCAGIRRNGAALIGLLNDLLDYATGEAGGIRIERVRFAPRAVVSEVADLFVESAARKSLSLEGHVADHVPAELWGDPWRLRQVMVNLLSNAIKFTEAGSVVVRVLPDGAPDAYRFEVADTGLGVPLEARSHLFRAFYRAPTDDRPAGVGTGLGLAISRQLVEAMGGKIGYTCDHRGSTFWFSLPLPAATDPAPRAARVPLRVLVVEDNPTGRIVVADMVRDLGHFADTADDGGQAVAAVQRQRYDVVLMDVWMPEMDGIQAAERIADVCSPGSRPRIIAVTGDATPETRARCLRAGMDDCLAKPLDPDGLRAALGGIAVDG